MTPEQYQHIQALFLEIRELSPELRDARIQELRGSDEPSALLIAELIEAEDPDFLEHPAGRLSDVLPVTESQPLAITAPVSLPHKIGTYRVLQKIGEGGHGIVYMAEQKTPIHRHVAIKVIKPGMESKEILARFEAERQALAMMKHPSIANVLDAGTTENDMPYFVMELVHGVPIDDFCRQNEMALRDTLLLFQQVCDAVHHAHQKGIIHRDLKPGNILVTLDSGQPLAKVIDFGIAKALHLRLTENTMFTEYGKIVGTLEYMSPEQATMSQDVPDVRSDVYSLGVVLYLLLTGATPISKQRLLENGLFELGNVLERLRPATPSVRFTSGNEAKNWRHFSDSERKSWQSRIRGDLDWITMKALEKDPRMRYESASRLREDLSCFLDQRPVVARPPSYRYQLVRWVQRHRVAATMLVAAASSIVICLAAVTWAYVQSQQSLKDVRAAESVANQRSADLEIALTDAQQQRQRANLSARKLASRLKREILETAWSCIMDGVPEEAAIQLASISFEDRGYLWQWIDSIRKQVAWVALRNESRGGIRAMAVSDSTRRIAVVTSDSQLEIWDLEQRRLVYEHELQPRIYACLSFDGSGQRLVLGAPNWVGLFDLAAGKLESECAHGGGGTRAIAHDRLNGNWLISTGSNQVVRLNNELEKEQALQLESRLSQLAIHSSGQVAAVATLNGDVVLFETNALLRRQVIPVSPAGIAELRWDDQWLCSSDRRGARFRFELQPGQTELQNTPPSPPIMGSRDSYAGICDLDLERMAVATRSGVVSIIDDDDEQIVLREFGLAIQGLKRSKTSGDLIIQHFNGRINVVTRQEIETRILSRPKMLDVTDGYPASATNRIISSHQDGTIRVWHGATGQELRSKQVHAGSVLSVDMHDESKLVASYGTDWKIVVSDSAHLEKKWSAQTDLGLRVTRFSNSGTILAAAADSANRRNLREGSIDLWDVDTGQVIQRLADHDNWVLQLAFSEDDAELYSLSVDGTLRIWTLESGKPRLEIDLANESNVSHFALLESESALLLCHDDGSLSLRSAIDGEVELRRHVFASPVIQVVAPSRSGLAIIAIKDSPQIHCLNTETLESIGQFDLGLGVIAGMRPDRDFKKLQVLSRDGAARLWDLPKP